MLCIIQVLGFEENKRHLECSYLNSLGQLQFRLVRYIFIFPPLKLLKTRPIIDNHAGM